ncbi:hypothetical protein AB0L75_35455 [Streptomyces sp. NPDC052101]|uniref:hypothetical protein n=1 Tax=Streptomyces sp. NPDC052101 TaxID=3155763 RepID=UPI003443D288
MSARREPGRHRGPSEGGRTVGLAFLAANLAGITLVGVQVHTARAVPAATQPDYPPAQALTDRPDIQPDRYGTRPPVP